ncbi:hypothetical protein ACFO0N_13290 [Halobium salinum]|uniref:t-SNARE coiled-coil homology domain-containing protein n=1 Tax=Halobium salinum TaxID=1364940 RepID=A0ABD5PDV4_9EURY|nr:hypothetical protein [Halobium salinum]
MSGGTEDGAPVTVERGRVTVEKTFEAEEFPVPAVKFVVRSTDEDAVDVRLTDRIPDGFPMKRVGFHPEFDSENWTAYKDQRVEYARTLDPAESVTTVYGVRLEGVDTVGADFVEEPFLEVLDEGEGGDEDAGPEAAVEAIVGEDNNQVVRDIVSGERDSVPGMDGEADAEVVESGEGDAPALDLEDPGSAEDTADPLAAESVESGAEAAATTDGAVDPLAAPSGEESSGSDPLDLDFEDPEPGAEAEAEADASPAAPDAEFDEPSADDPLDLDLDGSEPDATTEEPSSGPREHAADATAVVVERPDAVEAVDASSADESAAGVDADGADGDEVGAVTTVETDIAEVGTEAETDDEGTGGVETVDGEPASDAPGPTSAPAVGTGGVAAALATEIREGSVGDDDLALLKEELDLGGVPSSVDVRLGRLQSNVEDLAAYTDALETFLDEEGTGEEVISDLRAEVENVSGTVEDLAADLDVAAAEREGLRGDLDGVEADVSAGRRRLDRVDEELGEIREDLATLDGDVVDVHERVDDEVARVDGDVSDLGDEVGGLSDEVSDLNEDVTGLDDEVSGLGDDVARVDEDVSGLDEGMADLGSDVDDLRGEVSELRAEIEALEEFRNRLGSAFGGGDEGGEDDGDN